jgi:riboflavin kinase/FMN adenylyltransferase
MRRYFELEEARRDRDPAVERAACLGFFDGLHRGHRRLLSDLKLWAAECGCEPAVVTFDRHPRGVLGGSPPLPVLSLEHRLLLLERQGGVAATLVLRFDRELAAWPPETFVTEVFQEALGARRLLMGFDSAFGRGRQGTHEYLAARQAELGLEVRRGGVEQLDGVRISSTLVRNAVVEGRLPELEALLGRHHSVLGRVVHGDHRGQQLGFPTANLDVRGIALPPPGVYFAEARLSGAAESERLPAVLNLGKRPTVSGPGGNLDVVTDRLEVHLLDFSGDLYGEHLEVFFLRRHRGEKRFSSLGELAAQIRADVAARRAFGGV